MSNLKKVLALSRDEKLLLLQALIALPLTKAALPLVGLKRWQKTLSSICRKNQPGDVSSPASFFVPHLNVPLRAQGNELQRARAVARIVKAASSHGPVTGNCLQQSVVLWWLLRRNAIASEIMFGARREDGEFQAHAWVECFGRPLNEATDVHNDYSFFQRAGI
jgi:hypothetical protein